MTNVSDIPQACSSITVWTDFQNSSELVTESDLDGSVPSRRSAPFQLIFTAAFVAVILLANIVSFVAFLIEKRLRTYNNYFIMNLTILDLLVGLGLCTYVQHTYIGRYPFSQSACKILSGLYFGIVNASNLCVVVICADRHQAVYDPINHFISRTKRKAAILNSLPWVIGLSFWITYITMWEFAIDFDNGDHCLHRYTFNPFTYMLQAVFMFYLPTLLIAILYIRIFLQIRKTVGGRNVSKNFELTETQLSNSVSTAVTTGSDSFIQHVGADSRVADAVIEETSTRSTPYVVEVGTNGHKLSTKIRDQVESTAEMRKATRTLLSIVISFLTTWIPGSIISLIYSIAPALIRPGLSPQVFLFFNFLQYANSLLNPVSYALSQPLFRATIIRIFFCKRT